MRLYSLQNFLSTRAFNLCHENDLNSFGDLIKYYFENGNFLALRRCREDSNKELIDLCEKYKHMFLRNQNKKVEENTFEKIVLNLSPSRRDLIEKFIEVNSSQLSRRSQNALRLHLNGNLTLASIWAKILSVKPFDYNSIENAGTKSISEIKHYIEIIKDFIINTYNESGTTNFKLKSSFEELLEGLSEIHIKPINSYIKSNFKNLSVRSSNALRKMLKGEITFYSFRKHIFSVNDFDFLNIDNVGVKSASELNQFTDRLREFIKEVSTKSNEKELRNKNRNLFFKYNFGIENIPINIIESNSYFKVCDYILKCDNLFDSKFYQIIMSGIKIYNGQKILSNEEIGILVNLTAERVRQRKETCLHSLLSILYPLKKLDYTFNHYNLSLEHEIICISKEQAELINKTSNTNFNQNFCGLLLAPYLDDSIDILGVLEDVFQEREITHRNRHEWKNIYLIKKKLNVLFDFVKFLDEISLKLRERNEATYNLSMESCFNKFKKCDFTELKKQIFMVCEFLLIYELGVFFNEENNIVIRRNTKLKVHEYAYKALKKLDKPSKVNDIYECVILQNPDYKTSVESIRASMKREHGFVPIGRTSVYGLKEWEDEKINFKGGTIREIVEAFLTGQPKPVHIKEITNRVVKYRPKTNENSIMTNLKLDESNTFSFFKGAYIGIANMKYGEEFELIIESETKPKRTWMESYDSISSFVKTYNKLPSSNNCPESEQVLYRWLYVQRKKLKAGELKIKRASLIKDLIKNYDYEINTRERLKFSLNDLYGFVISYKRLPSPSIDEEKQLYHYYYRQRKLFDTKKMSTYDKNLYSLILAELDDNQWSLF